MGNTNVVTRIPVSPTFDYDAFAAYMNTLTPATRIWTPANLDHVRLPGNTDIITFLIYLGKRMHDWLQEIKYTGENPVYAPQWPDIIYTLENHAGPITPDSPHQKVPPIISYIVRKRLPASMKGGKPFGGGKHWKFRLYGDFAADNGEVYRLRSRWWESLIEFTIAARSSTEVERLTMLFENYMDLNEGKFLEAGVGKVIPYGRLKEPEVRLDNAGLHYRKTFFYFRTQEFQFAGPITTISSAEITADTNPTLMDDINPEV